MSEVTEREEDWRDHFKWWHNHVENEVRHDPDWDDHIAQCCFEAGFRAARSQQHQQAVEWISVDEQLPEDDGHFLTYRPDAHKPPSNDRNIALKRYRKSLGFDGLHRVTHWQPLPPPPVISGPVDGEGG